MGELCVSSTGTAGEYYGLSGLTNSTFRVIPTQPTDGTAASEAEFVRTGLLGFLGPVSNKCTFNQFRKLTSEGCRICYMYLY